MTKTLHCTLEVLEDVLSDDEDLDDEEPMMEGSDDEFLDLECGCCDLYMYCSTVAY